jgi:hypothetical protein
MTFNLETSQYFKLLESTAPQSITFFMYLFRTIESAELSLTGNLLISTAQSLIIVAQFLPVSDLMN